MINTPMVHLVLALMSVFSVSALLWAFYTFALLPQQYRILQDQLARGVPAAQALSSLAEPGWLSPVVRICQATLITSVLLVFFLHLDVDFTLFLILATLASGVIWILDRLRVQPGLQASKLALAKSDQILQDPPLIEYGQSFFPILLLVFLVRSFVAEPFTIPSGSMLPNLQIGDYILVNKFAYGFRNPLTGRVWVPMHAPKRGDIMVFRFPQDPRVDFIKRVVGLPGDHIVFNEGQLSINGKVLNKVLLRQNPQIDPWEQYFDENLLGVHHIIRLEVGNFIAGHHWEVTVPAHHYFMMGDNRDNSRDSRFWGFLDDHFIVGKASLIWMHKDEGWHLPSFSRDGSLDNADHMLQLFKALPQQDQ